MSDWSYTITHYYSGGTQNISSDIISIPLFTDTGSGEVNEAQIVLNAIEVENEGMGESIFQNWQIISGDNFQSNTIQLSNLDTPQTILTINKDADSNNFGTIEIRANFFENEVDSGDTGGDDTDTDTGGIDTGTDTGDTDDDDTGGKRPGDFTGVDDEGALTNPIGEN